MSMCIVNSSCMGNVDLSLPIQTSAAIGLLDCYSNVVSLHVQKFIVT